MTQILGDCEDKIRVILHSALWPSVEQPFGLTFECDEGPLDIRGCC